MYKHFETQLGDAPTGSLTLKLVKNYRNWKEHEYRHDLSSSEQLGRRSGRLGALPDGPSLRGAEER